jgi:ATP-dependent Clp endopeptidase proteolytic subunit ClpP
MLPVYINLQTAISQESAVKLVAAVLTQMQKGMTDLHLLMASGGGLVDPGMAIFNFLRGIPVKVHTYNYGNVDSVAGVIYCAGTRRLATPHCKFLVHGITWRIAPNTTELAKQRMREYLGQIDTIKRNIASVISQATGKTTEIVTADMTRGLTMTGDEAKDYGLVHEISTQLVPAGVEVIGIQ